MRLDDDFVAEVKARTDLVAVINARVPLKRQGSQRWAARCPFHAERTPSFFVRPDRGTWRCYGCGQRGDAVSWLMEADGYSFRDAVEWLAEQAGMSIGPARPAPRPLAPVIAAPPSAEEEQARAGRARDRAQDLWRQAIDPAGTVVEAYWRARGLALPIPPTIRYLPDHPYMDFDPAADRAVERGRWPVMLAALSGEGGRLITLHRTYLLRDGRGKAPVPSPKKLLGAPGNGAIRLTPVGPRLMIGEGIETTFAAWMHRRDWAAWAGYSISHMAGRGAGRGEPHPTRPGRRLPSVVPDMDGPGLVLPAEVERVVLLRDHDGRDQPAIDATLNRAAARFIRLGKLARIASPPRGLDFADWNRAA